MYKFKLFTLSALTTLMLLSFQTLPTKVNPPSVAASTKAIASPKITWVKDSYDFGEIPQGKPVTVDFSFTNNGDAPLLISEVVPSCGCTASDYPKEPIPAGKSSTIKITYNANAMGAFSKSITVKTNDQEAVKMLTIKGTVK